MGCVCCSLSSFVSIVLDALERVTLCTVCAMLTCCLMFTIIFVLILGVGIGFHYCFVKNSVEGMAKAAESAGALRSGSPKQDHRGHVMRSVDKAVKRGLAHRARRDIDNPQAANINTNVTAITSNFTSHNVSELGVGNLTANIKNVTKFLN